MSALSGNTCRMAIFWAIPGIANSRHCATEKALAMDAARW
jgi:hypothetical protein